MGALFFHFLSFLMNALKTFFNTGKWSKSSKWWILGIYDLDNAPSTKTYRTWVIVVLSFFLHSVSVGNIYAVGIFIPPLEDEFCGLEKVGGNFTDNSTFYSATIPISTPLATSCRGPISWIPTLGNSMLLAFSAPGGRFIDKWGFRIPTIVGGVLMAVSLFAASFASEIWHLYLSAGVLFGIGISLSFLPAVSVIGQWLNDDTRALGTGIAVAGSGVGNLVLPILFQSLMKDIGWRGAMQVDALICLIIIPISSLFLFQRTPMARNWAVSNALKTKP